MQREISKCRGDADESADIPKQAWIEVIENISGCGGANRIGDGPGKPCDSHITSTHVFGSETCGNDLTCGEIDHLTDANNDRSDHKHHEATHNPIHEYANGENPCSQRHHQKRRTMANHATDPQLK